MDDKPFDLDRLKRRHDQKLDRESRQTEEQRTQRYENNGIVVTPHGAFRKPEVANDVVKPEIFKMMRQTGAHIGGGTIKVTNQSGTWEGSLPMSRELAVFFGTEAIKYVIATADGSGKLHIQCAIIPDEHHKF